MHGRTPPSPEGETYRVCAVIRWGSQGREGAEARPPAAAESSRCARARLTRTVVRRSRPAAFQCGWCAGHCPNCYGNIGLFTLTATLRAGTRTVPFYRWENWVKVTQTL